MKKILSAMMSAFVLSICFSLCMCIAYAEKYINVGDKGILGIPDTFVATNAESTAFEDKESSLAISKVSFIGPKSTYSKAAIGVMESSGFTMRSDVKVPSGSVTVMSDLSQMPTVYSNILFSASDGNIVLIETNYQYRSAADLDAFLQAFSYTPISKPTPTPAPPKPSWSISYYRDKFGDKTEKQYLYRRDYYARRTINGKSDGIYMEGFYDSEQTRIRFTGDDRNNNVPLVWNPNTKKVDFRVKFEGGTYDATATIVDNYLVIDNKDEFDKLLRTNNKLEIIVPIDNGQLKGVLSNTLFRETESELLHGPTPTPAPTPKPSDIAKVKSFVQRCYSLILGREADEGGLNNWVNQLASGTSNAATIISNFLGSQEYINQSKSNTETVDILYNTMLNRPADEGGKTYWAGFLDNGSGNGAVINGFCGSQEFLGLCAEYGIEAGSVATGGQPASGLEGFVARCYSEALGRGSDEGGLAYWCNILQNKEQTPQQVAAGFVFSAEMNAAEKIKSNPDVLLDSLYKLYLGRPADEGGKAYWKQRIAEGLSLEDLNAGFAYSTEFSGIVASYGLE